MKPPLGASTVLNKMTAGCVRDVAKDSHSVKSSSIKNLSERPGEVRLDTQGDRAVPHVGNLFLSALTSMGPIWVLTVVENEVPQGTSRQKLTDDGWYAK